MKVMVSVKRVVDYQLPVAPSPDGTGVATEGLKMSMNPFDEIAVEEAVRLREAGTAEEVVAISCGGEECQDVLRTALALGVDRAILIRSDQGLLPLKIARLLKIIALREAPDLILMGKQAIDDDAGQVPQMLAAMLGWPQATYASKLQVNGQRVTVSREVDDGLDIVELGLPAVISTDLRLNTPRFASLANVMKARRKSIETVAADGLGVDLSSPHLQLSGVEEIPARSQGVRVADVRALADCLSQALGKLQ